MVSQMQRAFAQKLTSSKYVPSIEYLFETRLI